MGNVDKNISKDKMIADQKKQARKKRFQQIMLSLVGVTLIVGGMSSMMQPTTGGNVHRSPTESNPDGMQVGEFKEYKDFFILDAPIEKYQATPEKEVVEFFWFGCPHCYNFEPYLSKWVDKQPSNIVFDRIHPAFGSNWLPHSKTYYALKAMGAEEKYHDIVMTAIQENRGKYSNSASISELLAPEDREEFLSQYTKTQDSIDEANMMAKRAGINGVPSIIIDGKYVTSPGYVGSNEKVLELVDLLKRK